jgi:hypothetical protein
MDTTIGNASETITQSVYCKYPIAKKQMIESQCGDGKCYLRLISALPAFNQCNMSDLEDAIVEMTQSMGIEPTGMQLLGQLYVTNSLLKGMIPVGATIDGQIMDQTQDGGGSTDWIMTSGSRFMDEIFNCNYRFGWEEVGGITHISYYMEDKDECKDVYCEHGWSAKFIFCMMVRNGVRVGAAAVVDVSFSDLFGEVFEDAEESMTKTVLPFNNTGWFTEKYNNVFDTTELSDHHRDRVLGDMTSVHNGDSMPLPEVSNGENLKDKENVLGKDKRRDDLKKVLLDKDEMISKMEGRLRAMESELFKKVSSAKDKENDQTSQLLTDLMMAKMRANTMLSVTPDDSSSHLSRYGKRYMGEGTVLTFNKKGANVISEEEEVPRPMPVMNLTRGYVRTKEMHNTELDILKTIRPVNGLSNPFRSDRLNLLAHFHTALVGLKPVDKEFTTFDAIEYLSSFRPRTPSEHLAKLMVSQTFDLRQKVVVSNHYKFPYLEVGMRVSDDSLVKSLDMLRLEYKVLWFNEFKSLCVPDFHDKYNRHKDTKISRTTIGNSDKPKSKSAPQRRGSSILSFIN